MDPFKRVCLVSPDRWAGSLAWGLHQRSLSTEVVCIGDARTIQFCADLGFATAARDLPEGLNGSDLVLIGRHNCPDTSFPDVLKTCERNATVCGHGRGVAEVGRIASELERPDLHYISVEIHSPWNPSTDVSDATAADVFGQLISLTPSSVDDLEAVSGLMECLQHIGARVVTTSPRIHDRNLAEFVHLPRLILIPAIQALAGSLENRNASITSDNRHLLEAFLGLVPEDVRDWSDDLANNKSLLLAALDEHQKRVARLRNDLETDQICDLVSRLRQQAADVHSRVGESVGARSSTVVANPRHTPESLVQLVGSLMMAIRQADTSGSSPDVPAMRELVELTQSVLERLSPATVTPRETAPELALAVPDATSEVARSELPPEIPEASAPSIEQTYAPPPRINNPNEWQYCWPKGAPPPPGVTKSPAPEPEKEPEPFDLVIQGDSKFDVVATMNRLLSAARVEVRDTETGADPDGRMTVRVRLSVRDQTNRAREVLQRAGITVK